MQMIAITATFTAEPLEQALKFWMNLIGIPAEINFAPFNQVFQQLLDPLSVIAKNNAGVNIVLIRFEDWLQYDKSTNVEQQTSAMDTRRLFQKNIDDLTRALKSRLIQATTPYIVIMCPPSPAAMADAQLSETLSSMQALLEEELQSINGLYYINPSHISHYYPVESYGDQLSEKMGSIPYTQEFYTSLATMIVRKIFALLAPSYKVIVLDCDQTLWRGVLGEDGAHAITIDPPYKYLQEYMVAQYEAGMLICLCSKNNENDVIEAFKQRSDMPLGLDYIIAHRINWKSKSQNIISLAEELQLGLDSFIFIDDNPIECAEVRAYCPEVLTLQLPEEPEKIPVFLQHVWPFDHVKITSADRQRSLLYKENISRTRFQEGFLNFTEFIKELSLKIRISETQPTHVQRVAQLTQRTNQFNCTTKRRSEAEIEQLCLSDDYSSFIVNLADRFGDYGLVGVCIFAVVNRDIIVDTFLLSCRALGRGVEHAMLSHLGQTALRMNLTDIIVPYYQTSKNKPAYDFLMSCGQQYVQEIDHNLQFFYPAAVASQFVFSPQDNHAPQQADQGHTKAESSPAAQPLSNSNRVNQSFINQIARELNCVEAISGSINARIQRTRPDSASAYIPPRTPIEEKLVKIWRRFLHIDQISVHDNFYDIGGDSLIAVQISSEAQMQAMRLSPQDIFDYPTIADIAGYLADKTAADKNSHDAQAAALIPDQAPVAEQDDALLSNVDTDTVSSIYPLSPIQQGILYHTLYAPEHQLYFVQCTFTIAGNLNVAAFEQAWQQVISRHDILRTFFALNNLDKPLQLVQRHTDASFTFLDWSNEQKNPQKDLLKTLLDNDRKLGCVLSKAPLVRLTLIRLKEQSYHVMLSYQHILLDGWSLNILLEEAFALYTSLLQGAPVHMELQRPYKDYVMWLQHIDLSHARLFWQTLLKGFTPAPLATLPHHKGTPAHILFDEAAIAFSEELTAKLRSVAQQYRITLNTIVQACWAILLSRYTGTHDVIFGVTTSGRQIDFSGIDKMVGLFINTLPLRAHVEPNEMLPSFFKQLQNQQRDICTYEYTPLIEIQKCSAASPSKALFESIVVFENYPMTLGSMNIAGEIHCSDFRIHERTNYPLTVKIFPDAALSIQILYHVHLFDHTFVQRLLSHMTALIEAIANQPHRTIAQLPLLTDAEYQKLFSDWNRTENAYPQDACIHHLFEQQAQQFPEKTAAIFEHEKISYRELDNRASIIAGYLKINNVGPDVLVGICMSRSIAMVAALLGILKAGGAYVPLDPLYPRERLEYMIRDSNAPVILTESALFDCLPSHSAKIICLDKDWDKIKGHKNGNSTTAVKPYNLAYVIYTSGSTGMPKGVMLEHGSVVNFLNSMKKKPGLIEDDVMLAITTISFDIHVLEIFLPLTVGAQVVIVAQEVAADGHLLLQALKSSHATIMQATPSTWRLLLAAGWQGSDGLKALCGGEAFPVDLAKGLIGCSDSVWNMYGPTETTVWSTCCKLTDHEGPLPLGGPIDNTQIYILDNDMLPVPLGVPGELYIGGRGLARGYLNRQDLTSKQFPQNPFSADHTERLYKTGDIVLYRENGKLEYLNRIDTQVKVRGYRIELGEIEAVLSENSAIEKCVVTIHEVHPGDTRILAYAVPQGGQKIDSMELKGYLTSKLPAYMIPQHFIALDSLPLTPAGKIDRKNLPSLSHTDTLPVSHFTPPRNAIEMQLARIWEKALTIKPIGIYDNFFDLGGHSLLAVKLFVLIEKNMGIKLPLAILFQAPTIEQLAASIQQNNCEPTWSSLVPIRPSGSKLPLFLMHGAGGNVLLYHDLVRHLDENQPVYGFQSQGLDGKQKILTSIKEMASHYISEMRSLQPDGPYYLGGYCMGGQIAYEMACQLHTMGQRVALVAMFDTQCRWIAKPDFIRYSRQFFQKILFHYKNFMMANRAGGIAFIKEKSSELVRRIKRRSNIVISILAYRLHIRKEQPLKLMEKINERAAFQYIASSYPGKIVLFQPRLTYAGYDDPMFGWGNGLTAGVECYKLSAYPAGILVEPYVAELAEKLQECIEKEQSTTETI